MGEYNWMQCRVSLNLLLCSVQWSHQKLFLVKTDPGGEDLDEREYGDDYQNTTPVEYVDVDDCDVSGSDYYQMYTSNDCDDNYDTYEVTTATHTTTRTATTSIGRLPANKACRGRAVGARCIKRCCTITPTGNCCARSKASSTCTIKDGRIKCLFPDHNLFGAPPVQGQPPIRRTGDGAGLPANRACKTKQVGEQCIKRCCTLNPTGNCCARSKASSRCTVKDGRIRCLF